MPQTIEELHDKIGNLAREIVKILKKENCLLGLSESITGGQISAFLTRIDGCSKVLFGSQVVYSPLAKSSLCKIPMDDIEKHGTVSEYTVNKMNASMADRVLSIMKEVRAKSHFDLPTYIITVATSGVAGDSIEGKPNGFVIIGIKLDKINHSPALTKIELLSLVSNFNFSGNREEIILQASFHGLKSILQLPIFKKSD
ncbi:MAG: CinA family protein [Candidatus Hodarchaeota archaeon]